MAIVTVKSVQRMPHIITAGEHEFTVDEKPEQGDDQGMDPYEVLLGALGA
jgi:uncharacterized OsmC-like protein